MSGRGRRLRDLTLNELSDFRNRHLLDQVVRAVSMSVDADYLEAMRALEVWADDAAGFTNRHGEGGEMPLGAVLDRSPLTLDALEADVRTMVQDRDESSREILLDRSLPEAPAAETNEDGTVTLSEDSDAGRMLHDASTRENLYLQAKQLEPAYALGDGRQRFESDLRQHVEAGLDLIATLKAQQREAAIMVREADAERVQLAREHNERRRRARARALDRGDG